MRFIRITLFVLMGVLPLCTLLAWGTYRHTNAYQDSLRAKMEEELGRPVAVERFRFLRPNKMRLEGVKIFDGSGSETQSPQTPPLMEMPWILVLQSTDWEKDDPVRQMELVLPELTLDPRCLEPLWRFHQRTLERSDRQSPAELRVTVTGPVRVRGGETLELMDAKLWMRPAEDGTGHETDISFRFSEAGPDAPAAQWTLVRMNLRHGAQETGAPIIATIKTGENGLPTQLLASLFPPLLHLGDESRFYGKIVLQQMFTGWSGAFQGEFTQVDLSRYFKQIGQTAMMLGTGTLKLDAAEFYSGQLVRAEGRFSARNGRVYRDLLDRIIPLTGLTTRGIPLEMSPLVMFSQFVFDFSYEDGKIQIAGACEGVGPGVYLVGRNGPILCEPQAGKKPISAALLGELLR